jgi:intein-encoded DNA endonuclease-like protein
MEKEIVELYKEGFSNKELSERFNMHRMKIQRILNRNKIPLRGHELTQRKHFIKKDFLFENIDSADKAYFLGFSYADGSVFGTSLTISLNEKDRKILEEFSLLFYDKIKLGFKKSRTSEIRGKLCTSTPQYYLNINCKELIENLSKHGLIPNKSFVLRFPKIPEEFIRDFIRGYFDGDGCLSGSNSKYWRSIKICGNFLFCQDLQNIIQSHIGCNVSLRKDKTIFNACISGNRQVKKFLDWIYEDSNLKLERKYIKYLECYGPQDKVI